MTFPEFIQEFAHSVRSGEISFDRAAWKELFSDVWSLKPPGLEDLDGAESDVIDSGSPFGKRLQELLQAHDDWPFVVGNLDLPAWLHLLSSDPDSRAAEVYFVVSKHIFPKHTGAYWKMSTTAHFCSPGENRFRTSIS
eukprot:COSAG02_NODE_3727_length_6315_cov_20.568694_5_plen_138_part_00